MYILPVPTDKPGLVERSFDVLEDWAGGALFDSTEVVKERGVVLEEWRSGLGAGARIRDQQFPVLFKGSRYAVAPADRRHDDPEDAPTRRRSSGSTATGIARTSWRSSRSATTTRHRSKS